MYLESGIVTKNDNLLTSSKMFLKILFKCDLIS